MTAGYEIYAFEPDSLNYGKLAETGTGREDMVSGIGLLRIVINDVYVP